MVEGVTTPVYYVECSWKNGFVAISCSSRSRGCHDFSVKESLSSSRMQCGCHVDSHKLFGSATRPRSGGTSPFFRYLVIACHNLI